MARRKLRERIDQACENGENVVLACSGSSTPIRTISSAMIPCVEYVYLHGDEDLIRRRWRSEGGTS